MHGKSKQEVQTTKKKTQEGGMWLCDLIVVRLITTPNPPFVCSDRNLPAVAAVVKVVKGNENGRRRQPRKKNEHQERRVFILTSPCLFDRTWIVVIAVVLEVVVHARSSRNSRNKNRNWKFKVWDPIWF